MAVQCASVLPGLVFDEKSSLSHRWEMMRAPEAGSARRAGEDGAGAGGALELSRGDSRSFAARAEPLPAGRKELYALVCAAAWVLNRTAGGGR